MSTSTTDHTDRGLTEYADDETGVVSAASLPRHGKQTSRIAERPPLPPIAVILARPVILAVCAALGALIGFTVSDGGGYKAVASVEFTVDGNDVALVEVEGKTLADRMTTPAVISRAATSIDESPIEIDAATSSEWVPGSTLVEVTAEAPTPDRAWIRANALVEAAVADFRDDVRRRLEIAAADANSLIAEQALADTDAETARRTQVGTSLGDRQSALADQSASVSVARKATEARSAGLTVGMGTAIGLAAGLFFGCLIALALGSRGLRAWSLTTLRRFAPSVDVSTAAQLPKLVGELAESGESKVVVIAPRQDREMSERFASEVQRLFALHGKSALTICPPVTATEASDALLKGDRSGIEREGVGPGTLLVVVELHTEAATILQGRSGFRTIVLLRRYKSPVSDALGAASAYGPSRPVLMLAR
jgi:hypothetical protein